jgi:hypothetical protein
VLVCSLQKRKRKRASLRSCCWMPASAASSRASAAPKRPRVTVMLATAGGSGAVQMARSQVLPLGQPCMCGPDCAPTESACEWRHGIARQVMLVPDSLHQFLVVATAKVPLPPPPPPQGRRGRSPRRADMPNTQRHLCKCARKAFTVYLSRGALSCTSASMLGRRSPSMAPPSNLSPRSAMARSVSQIAGAAE